MKMIVFWCSLVEVYDVSEVLAASIIRAIPLMMEAVSTPETSANFQTTRRNITEDSHLQFVLD
jgi:hypothetical protein